MAPTGQPNVDFSSLSDEQLSEMLRDYGIDVGPVNAATRRTYERKLMKMKGQASPPSVHEPVDDDEGEDEIQLKSPQARTPIQSEPFQPRLRRDVQQESFTTYSRVESRPPLSAARKTTSTPYTPASRPAPGAKPVTPTSGPAAESKGGLPVWVKVLALLVLLVLVYLIYSNMEPQAVSNIPSISNKVEV